MADEMTEPSKPVVHDTPMTWVVVIGFMWIPLLGTMALFGWILWVAAPKWAFWVGVGLMLYCLLVGEEVYRSSRKRQPHGPSRQSLVDPRWALFTLTAKRPPRCP